jgi:hypothetical protein
VLKGFDMSNWKKGALHTHTFWSDGKSLPETAIHTYRDELKFDFVCITDHNIFPEEKDLWFPVIDQKFDLWPPLLYDRDIDREKSLPNCDIEEKKVGVRRFVRLKTFDEIKEQWEIPGKFLLIGGCELSGGHYPGLEQACFDIHFNVLNCHKSLTPPARKDNMEETFRAHLEVCKQAIADSGNNAILMLNHPFWRYWDIDPMLAVENPEAVNQVYNVAFGERTTLNELFGYLREDLAEFDPEIGKIEPQYGSTRAGDIPHSLASIEKAATLLGYSPEYSVKKGLKEATKWYFENL